MEALVFQGPHDIVATRLPWPPPPGPDEVTLRPTLAGVCGTDRAIYLGHYDCAAPRVLGHEAIGTVDAVGAGVTTVRAGDRVVLDPTQCCGRCPRCLRGESSHCVRKADLEVGVGRDGAFAQALTIEAKAVHRLPPEIPDRRAVLIEPLACVLNALRAAAVTAGDRVLVLGAGPIGVLAAMLAKRWAAGVDVIETDPYRRRLAERLVGVTPHSSVDLPADRQPSVVVDTTGTAALECLSAVRDGGRVLLLGCNTAASVTIKPFDLTSRCVSLIGSCDYHSQTFPVAVELMRGLPCEDLVTDVLPLSASTAAFGLLAVDREAAYRAGKVVFAVQES